jgi:hypothetical protein
MASSGVLSCEILGTCTPVVTESISTLFSGSNLVLLSAALRVLLAVV